MINEALRPAGQRSKHLTRISHHFMSDAQEQQTGAAQQLQLSVLVTDDLVQLEARALGPLTRVGEGGRSTLLHPAVLDTPARLPLTRNGHFPPRRFLAAALAAAREDYADLDWPLADAGTPR